MRATNPNIMQSITIKKSDIKVYPVKWCISKRFDLGLSILCAD